VVGLASTSGTPSPESEFVRTSDDGLYGMGV
jgi:hypothetical protein